MYYIISVLLFRLHFFYKLIFYFLLFHFVFFFSFTLLMFPIAKLQCGIQFRNNNTAITFSNYPREKLTNL